MGIANDPSRHDRAKLTMMARAHGLMFIEIGATSSASSA
jgi:hypothetical protein